MAPKQVATAGTAVLLLCAILSAEAYPLKNCTSDLDFIADDTDLCIFYKCYDGVPTNHSCAKGTRLPSYFDIGVSDPCTLFVVNSKCCRCDTKDPRPVARDQVDYCTIWKDYNLCESGCTCVNQVEGYFCDCKKPATPPPALPTVPAVSVPSCKVNVCLNGGTCYKLFDEKPLCTCPPGYTGDVCEHKLCSYNPCKNGGVCVSNGTGIRCDCPQCYTGSCCEARDFDDPDCNNCSKCSAGADCNSVRLWLCACNPCPADFLCADAARNSVRRCSKSPGSASDQFTLMFEENWTVENASLEVYVTQGDDDTAPRLVNVQAPLGSGNCVFNVTRVIQPGQVSQFDLPVCLRHDGSGKKRNGIRVTEVRGNTITVYAINRATFSADSWLCLPDSTAGSTFVVVTYKGFQEFKSQFGIVAIENNTSIQIYPSTNTDVPGTSAGSVISITLNAFETYQVQAVLLADISGTRINSSKPIHVVSGHVRAYVGPSPNNPLSGSTGGASRDHLIEEIIPTDYWGVTYAVVPLPRTIIGYSYTEEVLRAVGAKETQCNLYSSDLSAPVVSFSLLSSNRYQWEGYINCAANYFLSCTSKVLLMEITASALQSISLLDDPALIYLPAVSQYSNFYKSAPPKYSNTGQPYQYIFAKLAASASVYSAITVNGASPVALKPWVKLQVPGNSSDLNFPLLYGGIFYLPRNETSSIRHRDANVKFMCIIYAFDNRESIGHAAGTSLSASDEAFTFDVMV